MGVDAMGVDRHHGFNTFKQASKSEKNYTVLNEKEYKKFYNTH